MFKVGDCVIHQKTGHSGKVVGYGHHIFNSVYLPTIQVRVGRDSGFSEKRFVEDLSSAWMRLEQE